MTKVDLDKTRIAITYVTRMAEGKNPVNNKKVLNGEALNDPNLIRCMFFVRDVLEEVKEQNGIIGVEKRGESAAAPSKPFPFEVLEKFHYREDQSITHLLDQFKSLARDASVKPINYRPVLIWLKQNGFLQDTVRDDGFRATQPTEIGQEFGLYLEHRKSFRGEEYDVVMYNQAAQEYLAKNLEAIVKGAEVPLPDAKVEKALEEEKNESDSDNTIPEFDPIAEKPEAEEKTAVAENMVAEATV